MVYGIYLDELRLAGLSQNTAVFDLALRPS
jgi:hypothetical protein